MNTDQLNAFVLVATHRNISKAAKELRVSQPTVSRLIKHLEHELGVLLLDRSQRPITLTISGEEFIGYARQALANWHEISQRFQVGTKGVSGKLRVVASSAPGEYVVPRILFDFTGQYPEVEPNVTISDSGGVLEQLANRLSDVGFIGAPVTKTDLTLVPVGEDRIVLAIPAGHSFSHRTRVSLSELKGQTLIVREQGSGTLHIVQTRLKERQLSLPSCRIAMILGSTQAVVSAVREGIGIGFVSSLALAGQPSEDISAVDIEEVDMHRKLYMAYDESHVTSPMLREFIDFVKTRIRRDARQD